MNLNELRDRAYKIACEHGFHDKELSNEHWLCLVISELMEAVEADRKEKRADKFGFDTAIANAHNGEVRDEWFSYAFNRCIKDTLEDELADAFIRILDLAGARNVDLSFATIDSLSEREMMNFNYHSFTEKIFQLCERITKPYDSCRTEVVINDAINFIGWIAQSMGIDLMWHIEQKMKYNQLREKMHGKKY